MASSAVEGHVHKKPRLYSIFGRSVGDPVPELQVGLGILFYFHHFIYAEMFPYLIYRCGRSGS